MGRGPGARSWSSFSQNPNDKKTGRRVAFGLILMISAVGTFMVLVGNRLLGHALVAVLGPDARVEFAAGFGWVTVAWALCLYAEQASSGRARKRMTAVGTVMWIFAFLVSPVGGRGAGGAEGADAYAPWVGLGMLVSLPVSGGAFWVLRRPLRARRAVKEQADREHAQAVQDFRRYRKRLNVLSGDIRKTDDAFRQEFVLYGTRIPARPPEITVPDTSESRIDAQGNYLSRRHRLRQRFRGR